MKKILSFILVLTIALTACSGGDSAGNGDDKLVVWNFVEGPPKAALDSYSAMNGDVEVEFVAVAYEDYQTKLNTVLGTSEAPDIIGLERGFVGTYLQSDNILNFKDIEGIDVDKLSAYEENTSLATKGPGIYNEQIKGISWGVNASSFIYRSDLAEQCFGINSVEEMEAATQTYDDYVKLQEQLVSSTEGNCSKMSLFSYPDYQTGLLQLEGVYDIGDDSYTIPKEFGPTLDVIKDANDSGMVYSPQADKTQIVAGAANDMFIGTVSPAWGTQLVEEYNQPGQWSVADTPIDFTAGGTYMAVTSSADQDLVADFFNQTLLDEEWYIENMDVFKIIGNEKVMDKYFESHDGSSEYFGGQNVSLKLVEINAEIETYIEPTPYDSGIGTSINEVVSGYTVDKSIATTEDAANQLKDKIQTLYPDLEVIIEE